MERSLPFSHHSSLFSPLSIPFLFALEKLELEFAHRQILKKKKSILSIAIYANQELKTEDLLAVNNLTAFFFYFFLTLEPGWESEYSKDLPSFPLKKPKLEEDRDEALDRPLCIKQDSQDFSFLKKVKCVITQPKVKVHFLGLKKVSINKVKFQEP